MGTGACGLSLIGYENQLFWPPNSMRQSLISHQQQSIANPLHFQHFPTEVKRDEDFSKIAGGENQVSQFHVQ